jgi:hypothetical protein
MILLYDTIIQLFNCWYILDGVRRDRIYQRGNQNSQIEGQTTQWPKEKGQQDIQRSTKHYT